MMVLYDGIMMVDVFGVDLFHHWKSREKSLFFGQPTGSTFWHYTFPQPWLPHVQYCGCLANNLDLQGPSTSTPNHHGRITCSSADGALSGTYWRREPLLFFRCFPLSPKTSIWDHRPATNHHRYLYQVYINPNSTSERGSIIFVIAPNAWLRIDAFHGLSLQTTLQTIPISSANSSEE